MKDKPIAPGASISASGDDEEIKRKIKERDALMALEQAVLSSTLSEKSAISAKAYKALTGMPGWHQIEGAPLQDIEEDRVRSPQEWQAGLLGYIRYVRLIKTRSILKKIAYKHPVDSDKRSNLLQVANIWQDTEVSSISAISAEADILGNKLDKILDGRIVIERVEKQGRDALYMQMREVEGKHYVAHEVKSVTTKNPADVDQLIMEAEGQHRKRLSEETDPKRTWHKTTVVISNPKNPWPSSYGGQREKLFSTRKQEALIQTARYRLRRLTVGALEVGRQRKSDPQEDSASPGVTNAAPVTTADKGEASDPDTGEASIHEKLKQAAKWQLKKVKENHPLSDIDKKADKSVAGKNISTLIKERESDPHPEKRCMVVTERVRVIVPSEDICLALDRTQGGYFIGHIKKMTGKAAAYRGAKLHQRQPRRHWYSDDPSAIRAGGFLSEFGFFSHGGAASSSSHSPASLWKILLDSAKENDLYRVKSLIDFKPSATDKNGLTVLHYAVIHGNEEMVRFLCSSQHIKAWIDEPDSQGNSPLHYAHSTGNVTIQTLLIEAGASEEEVNEEGKQPKEIEAGELDISNLTRAIDGLDIGGPSS